MTTSIATKTAAAIATCCSRNLRRNSLHGVRTDVSAGGSATAAASVAASDEGSALFIATLCRARWVASSRPRGSAISNRRVDHCVEHVDDEVDQNEFQREEQHLGLDDRVVTHVDGIDQQASHAGPVEDHFDNDRATQQKSELQ